VRLLLDTHTFLWFVLNDPQLSGPAKDVIDDPPNDVLVSPATYWEIAIKVSKQKLDLRGTYDDFMSRGIAGNEFEILPVEVRHAAAIREDDHGKLGISLEHAAEDLGVVRRDAKVAHLALPTRLLKDLNDHFERLGADHEQTVDAVLPRPPGRTHRPPEVVHLDLVQIEVTRVRLLGLF